MRGIDLYFRSALTADGWTTFCPALLPHALRVYVIADAMSTSESCAHEINTVCETDRKWASS